MEDDAIKCLMEDNEPDASVSGSRFLLDLLKDIISNRNTSKYINIPVRSKIFEEYVLSINGVIQCLLSVGYEEGEDSFYLPNSVATKRMERFQEKLSLKMVALCKTSPPEQKLQHDLEWSQFASSSGNKNRAKNLEASAFPCASIPMEGMEASFRAKVLSNASFVLRYEDTILQAKARSVIPLDELKRKAVSNHSSNEPPKNQMHFRDYFLLELLAWFKHSFFKWVDAEVCVKCKVPGIFCGTTNPTSEELLWDANRVELLKCPKCNSAIRFPRYNHPGKLLETRKGRCGEWANCFTLCCRALGFESRFVVDWNDHVWTEVYSDYKNRWLHCDPCENICDQPLLYESGWGKKMTYVLAFSKYDVQDVTWRYSSLHKDVLQRRTLCKEPQLLEMIMKLTEQRQRGLEETMKNKLLMRKVTELVEFLSPKKPGGQDLVGRTSGSLTWRQERGEVQHTARYRFTLTENEIARKMLHITYSPVTDKYVRKTSGNSETNGWEACAFENNSLFRKVENDWNMVYLARTENNLKGSVSWKFDFTASGLVVDSLQVSCSVTTFENGKVFRTISNGITTVNLETDNQDVKEIQGSSWFLLKVELSGGKGPVAWQHAQLFRMSLTDTTIPLSVKVTLKAAEALSV